MSSIVVSQATKIAESFGIGGDSGELINVLKATAFKGNVSDAQMAALLVVAGQYKLNPFTKEIYAFPDRNNGIVPVVGVDGWSRIINSDPNFDGMDFEQDEESCTCIIYRKDRSHPIKVTEWMSECKRAGIGPWQTHPKRMLRHKAMIQCARLAFGFVGIYDQDEAERIAEEESRRSGAKIIEGEAFVVVDLESVMAQIAACNTVDDLREKSKAWSQQCRDARDEAAWAKIQEARAARKSEIEGAAQ